MINELKKDLLAAKNGRGSNKVLDLQETTSHQKRFNLVIYRLDYTFADEFSDIKERIKGLISKRPLSLVLYHDQGSIGYLVIELPKGFNRSFYDVISSQMAKMMGISDIATSKYGGKIPFPSDCNLHCASDGVANVVTKNQFIQDFADWYYLLRHLDEFLKMQIGSIPVDDKDLKLMVTFMKDIQPERRAMTNFQKKLRINGKKADGLQVSLDRKRLMSLNKTCWQIINRLVTRVPKLVNIINIFKISLVARPSDADKVNYVGGKTFNAHFEAIKISNVLNIGLRDNSLKVIMYNISGPLKGTYTTNDKLIDAEISLIDPGLTSKQVKDLMAQIEDYLINHNMRKITISNRPDLIACKNGIFNRNTNELINFSPKYVIESKLAVAYNPAWKPYLRMKHPFEHCHDLPLGMRKWNPLTWFLKLANNDKERQKTLLQMVLELVMTNFSHHKAFYLIGPGGVGKSTFLDVLQNLAGSNNYSSLNFDRFDQRFLVSGLINKVADIAHETADSNYMKKTQTYKAVVTGDSVPIEVKYQNSYSYTFKDIFLIQAGNAMPKVHDDAGASARRNIIVRFENKAISKNGNPNIKNDFICRNEFLEWLLCYVVNKTKDFDEFTLSKADHRAMAKQLYANDPVKQFITGIMQPKVKKDPEAIKVLMKRYVYDWYHNWAESLDYNPASEPKFVAQFNSDMNQMKAPLYVSKRMTISNDDVSALENIAENDTDGFMPYYRGADGEYPDYSKKYFAIMRVKNTQQRCFVLNR